MAISVFDLFKIGIGPSSSHTVGPMKAAGLFVSELRSNGLLTEVTRVKTEMYGSLAATGRGHGTPEAVLLGLEGEQPHTVDTNSVERKISRIRNDRIINLCGTHDVEHSEVHDLILNGREELPFHPNGMVFTAFDKVGIAVVTRTFYSTGGGFVVEESALSSGMITETPHNLPYPFETGGELLAHCVEHNLNISEIMWANEDSWRPRIETERGLRDIWSTMQLCVNNGIHGKGVLPGSLNVRRRASEIREKLLKKPEACLADPLSIIDWITLYALAVSEENAAGGRVVTAPTNGAAGIVPAVLHYYIRFVPGSDESGVMKFLLTAAAIGILYKKNASISGAEVGCQGEVGSACSMAAGALTEVLGGTPLQVENAAEIAMEHNLGLTCDPVGGLVQIPCIERNAMASIKAISASRMALRGDGSHLVSLDKVIRTMRDTGLDMQDKYKETARGGLAINVVDVPVNIIEC